MLVSAHHSSGLLSGGLTASTFFALNGLVGCGHVGTDGPASLVAD